MKLSIECLLISNNHDGFHAAEEIPCNDGLHEDWIVASFATHFAHFWHPLSWSRHITPFFVGMSGGGQIYCIYIKIYRKLSFMQKYFASELHEGRVDGIMKPNYVHTVTKYHVIYLHP